MKTPPAFRFPSLLPGLLVAATLAAALTAGCAREERSDPEPVAQTPPPPDTLRVPGEVHLRDVRRLTTGGENAEAYFSPDGRELVFQATRGEFKCDQIFRMPVDGGEPSLVSTGFGRTTCGYFMPDTASILFSSTHAGSAKCPERPDFSQGYVWAIHADYDIYVRTAEGGLGRLTDTDGYDAEATVSPRGDRIVFTSTRDGDIDIYSMNVDGSRVRRLTKRTGYEGGPFFSPDGREIVFRGYYPATSEEASDYRDLLAANLVRPSIMNLYVMNADGSNQRTVLENGAANFAPYFFPDGERIIFTSNLGDGEGRNFDLYAIHKDGSGLEKITYNETFDGFPMFSPDGRYLVFASNRYNREPHETNIFIAEWVD